MLGSFGKSWRRVDHRLFYPGYFHRNDKPMIGCHWSFGKESENLYITAASLDNIRKFLQEIQPKLKELLDIKTGNPVTDWREAWNMEKVQVWGKLQKSQTSEAVHWFHGAYSGNKSIKGTELTGKIGQIGRIWHRMYPRYVSKDGNLFNPPNHYVELLTIFPDDSQTTKDFLKFLKTSGFEKLVGL